MKRYESRVGLRIKHLKMAKTKHCELFMEILAIEQMEFVVNSLNKLNTDND